MPTIQLTKGCSVLVDEEQFEELNIAAVKFMHEEKTVTQILREQ